MSMPKDQIEALSEAPRVGLSLAEHGTFADPYAIPTGPTAHTPPFYPFLVAGIYRAFGAGYTGNLIRCGLTIAMYSLVYGLYPLFARALGLPIAAGVLGGLFSALLPLKRSAEWLGWDEPYATLLTAALLVLTLRVWKTHGLNFKTAVLYGLGWGLAFHMVPAWAPVVAALCAVHVIRFSEGHRVRTIQWWAVVAASVVLTILPWTLRNFHQFGSWMFMRDNLGLELYVSNHDQALASHEMNQALRKQFHPADSKEAAQKLRTMGEAAYNRELLHLAVTWIVNHPGQFLRLAATRAIYFWTGPWEHPETLVLSGLLTLFALGGLATIARNGEVEKIVLISTVWVVYPLVYYMVQYGTRYRVPIDWTITLPAAVFVYQRLRTIALDASEARVLPAQALVS
jgi:4-amino-4-deoxy-L-arabinose transferase-like glycosyltransferase